MTLREERLGLRNAAKHPKKLFAQDPSSPLGILVLIVIVVGSKLIAHFDEERPLKFLYVRANTEGATNRAACFKYIHVPFERILEERSLKVAAARFKGQRDEGTSSSKFRYLQSVRSGTRQSYRALVALDGSMRKRPREHRCKAKAAGGEKIGCE